MAATRARVLAVAAVVLAGALVCSAQDLDEYFKPVGVASYTFDELSRLAPAFGFIEDALSSSEATELKQRWQLIEQLGKPKSRFLSYVGLTQPDSAVKDVVDMLLRARDDVVECDGGSFVTLADIYRLANIMRGNGQQLSHVSQLIEEWIQFYREMCTTDFRSK